MSYSLSSVELGGALIHGCCRASFRRILLNSSLHINLDIKSFNSLSTSSGNCNGALIIRSCNILSFRLWFPPWKMRVITIYDDEMGEIVTFVSVYMTCKGKLRSNKAVNSCDFILNTSISHNVDFPVELEMGVS